MNITDHIIAYLLNRTNPTRATAVYNIKCLFYLHIRRRPVCKLQVPATFRLSSHVCGAPGCLESIDARFSFPLQLDLFPLVSRAHVGLVFTSLRQPPLMPPAEDPWRSCLPSMSSRPLPFSLCRKLLRPRRRLRLISGMDGRRTRRHWNLSQNPLTVRGCRLLWFVFLLSPHLLDQNHATK